MPAIQFQSIEPLHVKKSLFDLGYEHNTTGDMGMLIPIMVKEAIPSDTWKMGNKMIIRMAPMVAPIFHPINCKTMSFFVPNRLLYPKRDDPVELSAIDNNWENFITGGEDGENNDTIPLWDAVDKLSPHTIWDYFGLPKHANLHTESLPNKLALRAYNLAYNEFFRDQNLQDKVDLDDEALKYSCWEKDYFTSALPFQQRGTTPAIPLSGLGGAEFTEPDGFLANQIGVQNIGPGPVVSNNTSQAIPQGTIGYPYHYSGTAGEYWPMNYATVNPLPLPNSGNVATGWASASGTSTGNPAMGRYGLITNKAFRDYLNLNTIDFDNAGGIDIHIMRTAFQTVKWQERNARAGARYTEQLRARFNETAGDDRLDRPEFIGGTKTPIIISEVLQTAQNATPVGNQPNSQLGTMAGHGLTADINDIGTYRVKEHGWIITLLTIRPETSYAQGLELQYSRRTRFDYLTPEFANLSERAIMNRELYCSDDESYNETIFGYQGMYNEYRYAKNISTGLMIKDFSHWNLTRLWNDTNKPSLNSDFLTCKPDKRIFAVPSEPGFFINYGAYNQVVRPLPIFPEPGLLDHH